MASANSAQRFFAIGCAGLGPGETPGVECNRIVTISISHFQVVNKNVDNFLLQFRDISRIVFSLKW